MIKIILTVFSCLVVVCSAAADQCSTYNLNIQLPKKKYHSGDLVIMDIKVKNISQGNLTIQSVIEPQDYWLKLNLTHNGSNLKFIGPEKKLKDVGVLTTIRPGYYYGREITLNDYFDIKKPGEYTLHVIYGIGPDLSEIKHGKCIQSLNFSIR
jgi:hypothetical protein